MSAKAERGRADALVQRLPCSEVLQRRSSADGLEKCRLGWQVVGRSAQGHVRATREVAWCSEGRRRVAGLVARGPAGVSTARAMRTSLSLSSYSRTQNCEPQPNTIVFTVRGGQTRTQRPRLVVSHRARPPPPLLPSTQLFDRSCRKKQQQKSK